MGTRSLQWRRDRPSHSPAGTSGQRPGEAEGRGAGRVPERPGPARRALSRRGSPLERIARLVSESAVVIFGFNGCYMCHVARQLLCGMGVNPTVYELDEEEDGGSRTEDALALIAGRHPPVPAVFIGGRFIGGLERLMSIHIKGNLVPMLKNAGALWL